MCRLVGYLGQDSIFLEELITKPQHSLEAQSYQPREMSAGLLNADGFGVGWYAPDQAPFLYKNTLPIWSDPNLAHLGRYVQSRCILANVRSATSGQSVDLVNCQPFNHRQVLGIHNGFIENFRQSLLRPIRTMLEDEFYQNILGNTDSECILALFFQNLNAGSLVLAMQKTLATILDLSTKYAVKVSLNLIVSDGKQLVASRCSSQSPVPSLYFLKNSRSAIVASEPLFADSGWLSCAENSILAITPDLEYEFFKI